MAISARRALVRKDGKRLDGRFPTHVRPAYLKTGAASAAAGSAYAEFGSTKVMVSVFGPRESKKAQAFSDVGRLNCDVKFTSFATHVRGEAGQSVEEKEYSALLHKAVEGAVDLHAFPKTTVDVFALVIQSSGAVLPAVITCASLALADAGIVMYDLVAAISGSSVGSELLLDATDEEEQYQDGGVLVAAMVSRREITQVCFTGEWPSTRAADTLELCVDACSELGAVMRACLKEDAADEEN